MSSLFRKLQSSVGLCTDPDGIRSARFWANVVGPGGGGTIWHGISATKGDRMSVVIARNVEISEKYAERLKELAKARGAAENELVEEGLDLLFREQERRTAREEALRQSYEELARLEAELGPMPKSGAAPIQWEGAFVIARTPVPQERLRSIEDIR